MGPRLQWVRRWRPIPRRFAAIATCAGQPGPLLTLDAYELQQPRKHDSGRAAPHERLTPDSESREIVGRLLSVNVGMPKNVDWQGKTVFTGVFKDPVVGPRRVRELNVEGDGQGDLAGHGGEQRAVFVYQIDSYQYWERALGRNDFAYGQFGENFTVEGLADDEVCVGDRYQIGDGVFEAPNPGSPATASGSA